MKQTNIPTLATKIEFWVGSQGGHICVDDPFFCRDGSRFRTRQDETRILLAQTGYWFLSQFQLPHGLATLDLNINGATVSNAEARRSTIDFFAAYDKSAPGILWHYVQNLVQHTAIGTGFLDVHSADLLKISPKTPGIRDHGLRDLQVDFHVLLETSNYPPPIHFTRHRVFGRR